MSVDLSMLPQISFTEKEPDKIQAEILGIYETISGIVLQPADPVRLFLESLAYILTLQNGLIDLAGKQNLLAYARGAHLDHLGALMGVARIPARNSTCIARFTMAQPLDFAMTIPEGTRIATQDGKIVFRVMAERSIPSGDLYVDARCEAVNPGAENNGLVPRQVNCLVDPLPYIIEAVNITETLFGSDIEDDERLRERIRLAPETFTVAGSTGAYEGRALAVSSEIEAVMVYSEAPGIVNVCFTKTGGELPDAELIEEVFKALNADTVRPLTDTVKVAAPEEVFYKLKGRWFLKKDRIQLLSAINQKVNEAVEEFRIWQRIQPGRDINPTKFISLVEQAGARRVELDYPAFQKLEVNQIARETEIDFVFAGIEED